MVLQNIKPCIEIENDTNCVNDDGQKAPKFKMSTYVKNIYDYFSEFSNKTSIHGFRHLVENSAFERLLWLIIVCFCAYGCGHFIAATLKKWDESPISIEATSRPLSVKTIPFPAVTICPASKMKATVYNMTYNVRKFTSGNMIDEEEIDLFLSHSVFCGLRLQSYEKNHSFIGLDTMKRVMQSLPVTKEVLNAQSSFFREHPNQIKPKFSPILTKVGLCFSFNMLDKHQLFTNVTYLFQDHLNHENISSWSVDDNYFGTKETVVYPLRVAKSADILFLAVHVFLDQMNTLCNPVARFRIVLHHPAEVPIIYASTSQLFLVPRDRLQILIKPVVTITSTNLKHYDPHRRKCYYSNERRLKYFKFYTQENCNVECIANYTLAMCKCVSYYMPHDGAVNICGANNSNCTDHAINAFRHYEINNDVPGYYGNCSCLPSCMSIRYNSEQSVRTQVKSFNVLVTFLTGRIFASFKYAYYLPLERRQAFSTADFWAMCGGLLGLFTGFSVISLLEIIYYVFFKWMCNLRNFCCRT